MFPISLCIFSILHFVLNVDDYCTTAFFYSYKLLASLLNFCSFFLVFELILSIFAVYIVHVLCCALDSGHLPNCLDNISAHQKKEQLLYPDMALRCQAATSGLT